MPLVVHNVVDENGHLTEFVENGSLIWRAKGDKYQPFTDGIISSGDIVILSGLWKTKTGDILTSLDMTNKTNKELYSKIRKHLPRMKQSSPVFSAVVIPANEEEKKKLLGLLPVQILDDPSLRFVVDKESSKVILSGLGEVHLKNTIRKLKKDYQVDCKLEEIN